MDRPLVLSVLDQCPVPAHSTPVEALAASVRLAQAAEGWGYRRYWVAEHHNTDSLASASPEVVVAAVAARTATMRVGSGGVLLSHYSPLKVAETFRLLDALYPGRIDLGIGRAAGTDAVTEAALQYRPGALGDEHFGQKAVDLLAWLDGGQPGPPADHPYAGVRAAPVGPTAGPEVWVLGSSSNGAAAAAYLGLRFAFAHFITAEFGPQVMRSYRKGFTPAAGGQGPSEPAAAVAVSVVCADTEAEAKRLALSAGVWGLRPEGTTRGPLLPPDEAAAAAEGLTGVERERLRQRVNGIVAGDPDYVRKALGEIAGAFDVDELILLTNCHDPAARLRSYELLSPGTPRPQP